MDEFPLTEENMMWYQRMLDTYENLLSEEEKKELADWEKQHIGEGNKSTSDWPGWKEIYRTTPLEVEIKLSIITNARPYHACVSLLIGHYGLVVS